MTRTRTIAAALAATALVGCPIPQPLPDYPPGTVTPPRVLVATATSSAQSIIPVPAGCATAPTFDLGATVFYNQNVAIEARWFVDYKTDDASRYAIQNTTREIPPNQDATVLTRSVPGFVFRPYDYPTPEETGITGSHGDPGVVHVVELVVSNGFDTSMAVPEPNRTPLHTATQEFEIQVFRWTFVNVAGLTCP